MNRRLLCVVFLGSFLLSLGVAMSADEPKEVALPKMPKGAGKVDADAPKTLSATTSGLKYRVLRKGTGGKPMASDEVKVNYHGWFDDGKSFDSSYDRGTPAEFPLRSMLRLPSLGCQYVPM